MDALSKRFSANIRNYMHAKHLTQTALADKLKIKNATVSAWVTGVSLPRLSVVKEVADILGCSVGDLLDRDSSVEEIRRSEKVEEILSVLAEMDGEGLEKAMDYVITLRRAGYGNK